MLFALVAVIALTVDLVTLRLRAEKALKSDGLSSLVAETLIEITTSTQRWPAADGRFSIKQPAGWTAVVDASGTYDVTLRGPYRLELNVAVRPAGPGGLAGLRETLAAIEAKLNLKTSIQEDSFQGVPAWRRTMPLQKSTVETLDWLAGDQSVHVLMAAPPETFADFRPVLVELRESLQVQAGQNRPDPETP
jgi:hypothetical protein